MTEPAISELDRWFPPRGACGICGHPDARHRLWDAIIGSAGDSDETTARWYDYPVEAIQAVKRIRPYAREGNRMKLFRSIAGLFAGLFTFVRWVLTGKGGNN